VDGYADTAVWIADLEARGCWSIVNDDSHHDWQRALGDSRECQSLGSAPIFCAHLLRRVDEKLVDLLGSLEPSEWDLQTLAPLWKVRDVAAHLLDTVLRKLSMVRTLVM